MPEFRVLARHRNWVDGATISESVRIAKESAKTYRRFTATIRGFQGFRIWEGYIEADCQAIVETVREKVRELRDRIDSGDESVFNM